jgi:hypothetical protein
VIGRRCLAFAAAAVVATGCGAAKPREDVQVRAAVQQFLAAFAGGEFGVACGLMTPDTQTATVRAVQRARQRASDCPSALSAIWTRAPAAQRSALRNESIRSITLTRDTASVTMVRTSQPTYLRKLGGRWLVDARR